MSQQTLTTRTKALIIGDSELAGSIRAHNWSETPLGPIEGWSETLLATVNLMLHSPFPTVLLWGPEMVFLYNDAAIPTLTEKHPSALGGLYPNVFREAWDLVSGDIEACLYRGETAMRDNVFIPILFHGALEDHYWSYSLIPVYEGGVIAGVYDAFRNTTAIVTGARRLNELAAIVESSDDVILSKDLNGIITSWNAAATRILGYSAEEMIGTSILKLIPKDLHSDEKIIMENIRAGRRVEHFETSRLTKNGQLLDVSLTISPIRDEHGRVIGASKILRDVSIRKRLEQSLLQAEKIAATGRMAATIAHEINNPLEAVMNLLYLIGPMITDPVGINYFQAIDTELGRVAHIAKQTLGYYREHAAASTVAIRDVVLHAITIYEPRCTAAGIQIKKELYSSRRVVLRRGEMMQVVSNIIMNSIYAMQGGGVLSLSVEDTAEPRDGIVLTVQDDGAGIAEADMPRVFEAFFTTRSTVGTGIGLFVAKEFIEGHGGRIEIESRQGMDDHGTTVRVFLPMSTRYDAAGEDVRPKS